MNITRRHFLNTSMTLCRFLLLPLVAMALLVSVATAEADTLDTLRPFLKRHCYSCHGAQKQRNERRFDTLGADLSNVETLTVWQEILDQLNMGAMPPKTRPRPDRTQTAAVIDRLTTELKKAYVKRRSTGANTVVRRLNRFELRNTIRDLLYLNDPDLRVGNVARLVDNNGNGSVENTSTDPFRAFPPDQQEQGFDNIGQRLVMSDFFLKLMFDAVEESLDLATEMGPRPNVQTRQFTAPIQKQVRGDLERLAREHHPEYDTLYRQDSLVPDPLRGGVGTSGRYRITVELSGHNQKHPWGDVLKADQAEPLKVNLRLYKSRTRNDHISLKLLAVPGDGKLRRFAVETWIDARWMPQLVWENGPTYREVRSDAIVQKFLPGKYRKPPDRKEFPDKKEFDQARAEWSREMTATALQNYKGPSLRVHRITLQPLIEAWPPKSHTALYGTGPLQEKDIEPLLLAFAERAYRRPVTRKEITPFVTLVRSRWTPSRTLPPTIEALKYKAYKGSWTKLPDFSKLKPERSGVVADGLIDIRLANYTEHYGIVFEGRLNVGQSGEYEFQMASDDGARIQVNGKKVVEHDGLHGASLRKGKAKLEKGTHPLRVEYFAYGKPNSFRASWSGPGFREVPLSVGKPNKKPVSVDARTVRTNEAMQAGYTAILCSPDFLYLREKGDVLDDYEIASRLSYFLWSSLPDEQLFALAKAGKLRDESVFQQQVDRMLDDPKSAAFTRHFTERWLRLDKLSESPPELNGPFRIYWDRRMEPQIVAQTDAYFADLVKSNGSIRLLIESDYTFMNEGIASVFYGRTDVRGESLRKVATDDPRRGGILTQPAVMTATANGVDTSPVVRGVWVLENILGTPAAPPPPDVEPLSPDLREAKTIREQLKAHRKQEACRSCHQKIDPLGFAFENFDPIGRWRDKYPRARDNIDASSKLNTGEQVADIVAFKKHMLTREQEVARCLTEKLLVYSSGRLLEPPDRGEVDRIVAELGKRRNGLRDLIRLVAQSNVFLRK